MTLTLKQARQMLPNNDEISNSELEEVLAYFYFLGEKAYEQVREEANHEQ